MNWAAFFGAFYHASYRNMWKNWLKALCVPVILMMALCLVIALVIFSYPTWGIAAGVGEDSQPDGTGEDSQQTGTGEGGQPAGPDGDDLASGYGGEGQASAAGGGEAAGVSGGIGSASASNPTCSSATVGKDWPDEYDQYYYEGYRYLDVISGVMQSYDTNCEFALYDMDWDGVEELIVGYGESNAVLTQHNVFRFLKPRTCSKGEARDLVLLFLPYHQRRGFLDSKYSCPKAMIYTQK